MSDWIAELRQREDQGRDKRIIEAEARNRASRIIKAKPPRFWQDLTQSVKDESARLAGAFPEHGKYKTRYESTISGGFILASHASRPRALEATLHLEAEDIRIEFGEAPGPPVISMSESA